MSRFFAFVEGLTCKPSTWSNCLSSSFEMPLSLSISVVARITYSLVVIRFLYFIYILIFYLNTFFLSRTWNYRCQKCLADRSISKVIFLQFSKKNREHTSESSASSLLFTEFTHESLWCSFSKPHSESSKYQLFSPRNQTKRKMARYSVSIDRNRDPSICICNEIGPRALKDWFHLYFQSFPIRGPSWQRYTASLS